MNRLEILVGALVLAFALPSTAATGTPPAGASMPGYAGSASCTDCHATEARLWHGSHHDLAMAEPSDETVLGDFDDAELTAHGVRSRFFRKDGAWTVRTDGPDGELHDYPIAYTFGWTPLQQYLIEMPGGRLQALGLAWDTRPAEAGGQRWFHLYPDEADMGPDHPLHWTARDQTWNYQCAECHSTALTKGYDPATDSYATTWAEIDVACEACHGPAARHVEQARAAAAGDADAWSADKGLAVDLADSDGATWLIDRATGLPRRSVPRTTHVETELCARCHSRRGQISAHYVHGKPLADTHLLSLLDPGLYFADGQILDEVFVHGSFLQSRMYASGVTCTDCHDPHSLDLKQPADLVCGQCHPVQHYADPSHHHHEQDGAGASCVACHMPSRTYMVVDDRADHSLRIPRPDLTLQIGTPNACNQCHADQSADWAQAAITDWYGTGTSDKPHYGQALHAGRGGDPDAPARLLALATDTAQPAIARATALELMRDHARPGRLQALPGLLADPDPLVRRMAVNWLEAADPRVRYQLGWPLLDDPILSVRLEAARTLAPLVRYELPAGQREQLEAAVDAYRASQLVNAERPESHLNIGLIDMAQGKVVLARKAYLKALELDPGFVPAYANLADLYRTMGSDQEARETLRQGLAKAPDNADLHHALGLLQVRRKDYSAALASLKRAAELAPDNPRYAYVYGLALKEHGDPEDALRVLTAAYNQDPANRDLLLALITIHRDQGDVAAARSYAQALRLRWPDDPQAEALNRELAP